MGNAASVTVRHVALEKVTHVVKTFKFTVSKFEKFYKNKFHSAQILKSFQKAQCQNFGKVSFSPRAKFEGRSRPRRRRRPLRKGLAVGERWLGGRLEAESTWLNLEHVVKIWNTW